MSQVVGSGAERVRYYDGARLAGSDLTDDRAYESRLRGMHVRALHDTWGIALGLTVRMAADRQRVLVTAGLAYDCHGGELLLADSFEVRVPAGPPAPDLVLAICAAGDENNVTVEAPCPPGGFHPALERPAFVWRRPGAVRLGDDVPLARVHGGGLDLSVRRYVQPLLRPHIGWGVRPITPGDSWRVPSPGGFMAIGYRFVVDTSEAGFTETPLYFAALQGGALPQAFPAIVDAAPDRFTFQVVPLFGPVAGATLSSTAGFVVPFTPPAEVRSLFWLGVEPVTGCEPQPGPVYSPAGLRLADATAVWLAVAGAVAPAFGGEL